MPQANQLELQRGTGTKPVQALSFEQAHPSSVKGASGSDSRQPAHAVPEFAKPRPENRRPVHHAADLLRGIFDVGGSGQHCSAHGPGRMLSYALKEQS